MATEGYEISTLCDILLRSALHVASAESISLATAVVSNVPLSSELADKLCNYVIQTYNQMKEMKDEKTVAELKSLFQVLNPIAFQQSSTGRLMLSSRQQMWIILG